MQARVDLWRDKRAICQHVVAIKQQAVLVRAWRSWQARLQRQAAKRGQMQRAALMWQNGCLAACWRAWAGRASHKRQVAHHAAAFICEHRMVTCVT